MNKDKVTAVVGTYLRAAIAAVIALYISGTTEPKALLMAGVAAIAGPVLKWLDPNETAFGRGSQK